MTERTLVDSNVLLDVVTADPTWGAWSAQALATVADRGPVVLSPIVYAEVGARFERIESLDELLGGLVREPMPWDGAYLAGRAHARYRARGGSRERTLSDYLIGAHAAVRGHRLLTRDARRYRESFPHLVVISPDGAA